jgi:hypothetical protein
LLSFGQIWVFNQFSTVTVVGVFVLPFFVRRFTLLHVSAIEQ